MLYLKKRAEISKECHPNMTYISIGHAWSTDSKGAHRLAKLLISHTPYQIVVHLFGLEGTFI